MVQIPGRTCLCFLAFAGTARKTQSSPVRGEAAWPAAWPPAAVSSSRRVGGAELAGAVEGRVGGVVTPRWPDRLTCFLPATSTVDLPRPPETTAAVVTAPHSRARDVISESLVHVPLETFLETLESPGGSGGDSNNTGAKGLLPAAPPYAPSRGHRLPPKPFLSLRGCDISTHLVLCTAAENCSFCGPLGNRAEGQGDVMCSHLCCWLRDYPR